MEIYVSTSVEGSAHASVTAAFERRATRAGDQRDADERLVSSRSYRGYVLALLVLVGVLGWIDRNVFSILLESIKQEFSFSDTQLGLLGGVAFGLFYATLGLPIAWLADRYSRRTILALAVGIWSLMTALCGFATGFVSLFLGRLGVGIGEAGGTPPTHSLVSDYFPPEKRGFALGILYLYIPLGFLVGFLAGGWLDQFFGWRAAFLVVGVPGIVVAIALRWTLHEPKRGTSEKQQDSGVTPTLWSSVACFVRTPSLRHIPLGGAAHGIGAFAAAVWLPAFFIRAHGLTTGEAGTWMAVAYGLGGGIGVLCGGYVADHLARSKKDERWYAWQSALAIAITAPCMLLVLLSNTIEIVLGALFVAAAFGHMHLGPITAMMQRLAGMRQRAMVVGFYLFFVNLIAMGLGPVLAGAISDALTAALGNEALRYALLTLVPTTSLWAATHFLLVARTLREDRVHA